MKQTENERFLFSLSFDSKFELHFVLIQKRSFILKPTEIAQVPQKTFARYFQ